MVEGIRLEDLATQLGLPFAGNPDLMIRRACGLSNVTAGGLCYLTTDLNISGVATPGNQAAKIAEGLQQIQADVAIIVKPNTKSPQHNLLFAADPLRSHVAATQLLHPPPPASGAVHPTAVIGANVTIGEGVTIDPYVVIYDHVTIGAGTIIRAHSTIMAHSTVGASCLIHPQVVVREHCHIGDHCVLHAGAVIGADGHGYFQRDGQNIKLPQVGGVTIGNHVEIGAGTTIDRGRLEDTVIGDHCKLDNQVQIGHNVELGNNALISGQSAIGGSTKIGHHLILGGQSGVVDHVRVGDHVSAIARTAITSNTASNQILAGMPSRPLAEWRDMTALQGRLAELVRRLGQLEAAYGGTGAAAPTKESPHKAVS